MTSACEERADGSGGRALLTGAAELVDAAGVAEERDAAAGAGLVDTAGEADLEVAGAGCDEGRQSETVYASVTGRTVGSGLLIHCFRLLLSTAL